MCSSCMVLQAVTMYLLNNLHFERNGWHLPLWLPLFWIYPNSSLAFMYSEQNKTVFSIGI